LPHLLNSKGLDVTVIGTEAFTLNEILLKVRGNKNESQSFFD